MLHDATEYFIILANELRIVISENKLFHVTFRDELSGIAEFIFGWRWMGCRIDQINPFSLALRGTKSERCQTKLTSRAREENVM